MFIRLFTVVKRRGFFACIAQFLESVGKAPCRYKWVKTHVKVKQKRFNGGETWPSKIGTNVNFNGQKGKIISEMVDAASHVNWFFDEAGYRLSATSLRWISISP